MPTAATATPVTPAMVAALKSKYPPEIVDECIAAGDLELVEEHEKVDDNGNTGKN